MRQGRAPFGPYAFPHWANIKPGVYTQGVTGGATRNDSTPVLWPANFQLAANDKIEREPIGDGNAEGGHVDYDIDFPNTYLGVSLPALKTSDGVDWLAADKTTVILSINVNAPTAPVFGGGWQRARGASQT